MWKWSSVCETVVFASLVKGIRGNNNFYIKQEYSIVNHRHRAAFLFVSLWGKQKWNWGFEVLENDHQMICDASFPIRVRWKFYFLYRRKVKTVAFYSAWMKCLTFLSLTNAKSKNEAKFFIAFSGNFSAQIIDDCGNRKVFRFCYNLSRLLGSSIA